MEKGGLPPWCAREVGRSGEALVLACPVRRGRVRCHGEWEAGETLRTEFPVLMRTVTVVDRTTSGIAGTIPSCRPSVRVNSDSASFEKRNQKVPEKKLRSSDCRFNQVRNDSRGIIVRGLLEHFAE